MDNDDLPVGRILTRREAIRLLGVAGAAALVGCRGPDPGLSRVAAGSEGGALASAGAHTRPACIVRPEMTIGPYFVSDRLNRSDIRSDPSDGSLRPGAPLALTFNVTEVRDGACIPFAGALVDVWQCDAQGVYSGVTDNMQGLRTVEQKFLRGYQVTDADGVARFQTIYPGWYPGRTVHIHFRIRTAPEAEQDYDFTSQLFFDDSLTDQVHAREPYASRGRRSVRNANDGIYRRDGDQLLLDVARAGEGYQATFAIGLDLSDAQAGAPDNQGGRGGPGGRPPGRGRAGGPPPPPRA